MTHEKRKLDFKLITNYKRTYSEMLIAWRASLWGRHKQLIVDLSRLEEQIVSQYGRTEGYKLIERMERAINLALLPEAEENGVAHDKM